MNKEIVRGFIIVGSFNFVRMTGTYDCVPAETIMVLKEIQYGSKYAIVGYSEIMQKLVICKMSTSVATDDEGAPYIVTSDIDGVTSRRFDTEDDARKAFTDDICEDILRMIKNRKDNFKVREFIEERVDGKPNRKSKTNIKTK